MTTRPIPQTSPNRPTDAPQTSSNRPLGVDLAAHYGDIRRLVFGTWGERIEAAGLDADEVLSRVYERIHRANTRPSAYDPTRGSLGNYVYVVTRSVVANLMASEQAARRREERAAVDLYGLEEGRPATTEPGRIEHAALEAATSSEHARALLMMAAGATDEEVVEACGDAPVILHELAQRGAGAPSGRREG